MHDTVVENAKVCKSLRFPCLTKKYFEEMGNKMKWNYN